MKTLFFLLIFSVIVNAKVIEAKYRVSFGMIGTIGEAKTILMTDGDQYKIVVDAEATGTARFLSNGRKEHYESEGSIVNGLFLPERYLVEKYSGNKHRKKVYHFDHEQKSITQQTSTLNKSDFKQIEHMIELPFYAENKWKVDSPHTLDYYAKNDLLSLYFNTNYLLQGEGSQWDMKTVGAKSDNKTVTIRRENDQKVRDFLKTDVSRIIEVIVHQKIFASEDGRLLIAMDDDGVTTKAILKDVLFFGDIRGELVEKKTR
jgi:hypothetical protein